MRLVAYAPYESGASTIEQMKADLKLARDMGFEGVKLWDNPSLLRDGNLAELLDVGRELGLKFNLPLMIENCNDFPDDNESITRFGTYLIELARAVSKKDNILWYGLWYPIAWSEGNSWNQRNVARPEYQQKLQEFIDILEENDPGHEIRLFADADPWLFGFPKDFTNVDGYGVQPYSHIEDSVDRKRIESHVSYFLDTGKTVYIDEWGLHTSRSPNYGLCAKEENKARVLTDFISFVEGEGLTWTYFMLFDSHLYPTDWGIVNGDRSLRPSGRELPYTVND